jgi:uncharacterized membrane protein YfcA
MLWSAEWAVTKTVSQAAQSDTVPVRWSTVAQSLQQPYPVTAQMVAHVAHSFVSALTCWRVHRKVGLAALLCATVVAMSTLFTKQHYVRDVLAGSLLAYAAYAVWLRTCPPPPRLERRLAPFLACSVLAIVAVALGCFWVVYRYVST